MVKTLEARLGPGVLQSAARTRISIDDVYPDNIIDLTLILDGNDGRPASFSLHRVGYGGQQVVQVRETCTIRSLSLTIKYEED